MPTNLEIEDTIVRAHEGINAWLCEQFEGIVLFDFREAYKDDGARNMADWLAYRLTIDHPTAREYIRAAKALDFLPAIKDAFRDGHLSWDQVRWLVRFATFDEDVEWASRAIGMSVAEIRRIALYRERLTRQMADARSRRRYVRARHDLAKGWTDIWMRLPDVEGEIVLNAIDRVATVASPDVSFEQRRADALVEICSMALGADTDRDRATVVVHVDVEDFIGGDGNGMLESGMAIANETVRRLTCDSRIQAVLHTADGIVAGRVTRTVPAHLRRELRARDGKCAFTGCSNTVWVDAHHIEHHANGGRTQLDNMILLCGVHHRLVHEGDWRMEVTSEGDALFIRPDGKSYFARVGGLVGARAP